MNEKAGNAALPTNRLKISHLTVAGCGWLEDYKELIRGGFVSNTWDERLLQLPQVALPSTDIWFVQISKRNKDKRLQNIQFVDEKDEIPESALCACSNGCNLAKCNDAKSPLYMSP